MAKPKPKISFDTSYPPRLPGVYQIRCTTTEKVYIGSSVDVRSRWKHHEVMLSRGKHGNVHLQQAWDKYGPENFEFSILEFVSQSELLVVEQKWIDKTRCADRRFGFNIFDIAGSPGDAFALVWEGFIDPDGNEVKITNLFDFCRQNGLDWPSMHRLAMGKSKLKSYKGWTHKNSIRRRDYIKTYDGFISPDGRLVGPITNLAEFCRENGLDNTHMVAVAHGRICSHRGWTHKDGKTKSESAKTYTGFIGPNGHRVAVTNLAAFCRENGLQPVRMHEIKNGKRNSHKGWTWREDED